MIVTRRGLLGILAGAVAAPIVVQAASIMPVKSLPAEILELTPEGFEVYLFKNIVVGFNFTHDAIDTNLIAAQMLNSQEILRASLAETAWS